MAASNSPRDHIADANPELSRKRIRYSGDGAEHDEMSTRRTSRSPSLGGDCQDEIAVQLVDDSSDHDSVNDPTVHILHDGTAPVSLIGAWTRDRWPDLSPPGQIHRMNEDLRKEKHLDYPSFKIITAFLRGYGNLVTKQGSASIDGTLILQDEEFFGELASFCQGVLNKKDGIFAIEFTDDDSLRNLVDEFFWYLTHLSAHIVGLLPYITKAKLSRRDSAQGHIATGSSHIVLWRYVEITAQLISGQSSTLSFVERHLDASRAGISKQCRTEILNQKEPFSALVTAFDNIVRSAKEIKDGWSAAAAILIIVSNLEDMPPAYVEAILRTVTESVLPLICEQHPRNLPVGFHEQVLTFANHALARCAINADPIEAGRLYQRFVQSDTDAVLPEGVVDNDVVIALVSASDRSSPKLAELLPLAWSLQAIRRYIYSNIMMVRSTGMNLLTARLLEVYRECSEHTSGLEHPTARYAARFLRVNEVTKYIFSADSHASLIAQSQDVICYLGVTNSYTNQETDIIWAACTTNVEAEFVKVSFNILRAVSRFVGLEHLIHMAELYRDTPPAQLSIAIIDFLPELFAMIRNASDQFPVEQRLATSNIAFDMLLRSGGAVPPSHNMLSLLRVAMNEMAIYAARPSEERLHLLQRYISLITGRTPHATLGAELLSLFLERSCPEGEPSKIADMIPVSELVDELGHYAQSASRRRDSTNDILHAVTVRLSAIVNLSARVPTRDNRTTEDLLFEHLFGSLALNNDARDAALRKLAQLAQAQVGKAPQLMDRYLNSFAPQVSADHVTPALIQLMIEPLTGRITADILQSNTPQILNHPLWLTLRKVAETASHLPIARSAIDGLCHLLFEYPKRFGIDHVSCVISIQEHFARQVLESLGQDYADLEQLDDLQLQQAFLRRVDILEALLKSSHSTRAIYQTERHDTEISLRAHHAESTPWSFSCHIHFMQCQLRTLTVIADDTVRVADLFEALARQTCTAQNHVIVRGHSLKLDEQDARVLGEVGIQPLTSILVAPRYAACCDIDDIIAVDIPLQKALSAEFARLDKYVDGPMLVAQRTFTLLRALDPPASARARLTLTDVKHYDILPKDRPWRTMLSLHILRSQLSSFVRLGIIDDAFMSGSVLLLTDFLVHSAPDEPTNLTLEVMHGLLHFLQEQPCAASSLTTGLSGKQPDVVAFFSSMLLQARSLEQQVSTSTSVVRRTSLVVAAYECLLQMSRHDDAIWASVEQDATLSDLIPGLLLDEDALLSESVMAHTTRFCDEHKSRSPRISYYWRVISGALSRALQCPSTCGPYFQVATQVLELCTSLNDTETQALLDNLLSHMRRYRHTETADMPFPDMIMLGLLKMLEATLAKLKKSKKPMDLIGVDVMKSYLFPPNDAYPASFRPLITREARAIAFRIVEMTCQTSFDYQKIVELSTQALSHLSADVNTDFPGHEDFLRQTNVSAGLTNLGMTCYMNSLLQQLYGNLLFRKFILELTIKDPIRQEVLVQIQQLFVQMQVSAQPCINTSALAKTLRIEVDSQEDVHGFFAILISTLEDSMPDDEAKATLMNFFSGKFTSQIKGQCGHVSTRVDPFNDISITVRNKKGLHESLDEFVQGEPMQGSNKYKCLTCDPENGGRLVDAMKRTCLGQMPDNLTFCLKRFTWEDGFDDKVNDRFEFPAEIDMSVYSQQYLEDPKASSPDIFELAGVIVHQGTLSFGHYWSYVRTGSACNPFDPKWTCLEDCRTRSVKGGVMEVQEQCFGGHKHPNGFDRTDNAYVLLYQRKAAANAHARVVERPCAQIPILEQLLPIVSIPGHLTGKIMADNVWRYRVAHLFQDDFLHFLMLMFRWASKFTELSNEDLNAFSDTSAETNSAFSDVVKLAAIAFLRLMLNNPEWEKFMKSFLSSLNLLRTTEVASTALLIRWLTEDHAAWSNIWIYRNPLARSLISTLLVKCLEELKYADAGAYSICLKRVLHAHAYLFGPRLAVFPDRWSQYFTFLGNVCAEGSDETAAVLDIFDIRILFELMCGSVCTEQKDRKWLSLRKLHRHDNLDLRPIFEFFYQALQHVDVGGQAGSICADNGPRRLTAGGVCLREGEMRVLRGEYTHSQDTICDLVFFAYQCDAEFSKWQEHMAGRLIALLVGSKDTSGHWNAFIFDALGRVVRKASDNLNRILCLSLHYCAGRGDDHCTVYMVKEIVETIKDWQRGERQGLEFVQKCFPLAPRAVVENVTMWAPDYLFMKEPIGMSTMQFLNDHVLQLHEDEPTELDMARLACLRRLGPLLLDRLQRAQGQTVARSTFECAIQFVQQARHYLQATTEKSKEWTRKRSEQGVSYRTQAKLQLELDESATTRRDLLELSRMLDELILESSASVSEVDTGGNGVVEAGSVADEEEEEEYDYTEDEHEEDEYDEE